MQSGNRNQVRRVSTGSGFAILAGLLILAGAGLMLAVGLPGKSPPAALVAVATAKPTPATPKPKLTRDQIVEARRKFRVEVIKFDASQEIGTEPPYADYVQLRFTNSSKVTLPWLTVMTKRYSASGEFLGGSRAPSIPASDIKPGQTVKFDYYPRGHFSPAIATTSDIKVEIEDVIAPDEAEFFRELQG